jgi:hypothetical protein
MRPFSGQRLDRRTGLRRSHDVAVPQRSVQLAVADPAVLDGEPVVPGDHGVGADGHGRVAELEFAVRGHGEVKDPAMPPGAPLDRPHLAIVGQRRDDPARVEVQEQQLAFETPAAVVAAGADGQQRPAGVEID